MAPPCASSASGLTSSVMVPHDALSGPSTAAPLASPVRILLPASRAAIQRRIAVQEGPVGLGGGGQVPRGALRGRVAASTAPGVGVFSAEPLRLSWARSLAESWGRASCKA